MNARVVQINQNIKKNDGITNYVLGINKMLMKNNIPTVIYAYFSESDAIPDVICVESLKEIKFNESDIILYHMSIGSPFNREVLEIPNKKILIYHNITPYDFMSKWSQAFESNLRAGLIDVRKTVGNYDCCITFSDFSKKDLIRAGWDKSKIHVIPYFNYFQDMDVESDPDIIKRYQDDYINILFVGRIVPNKRQDLIIINVNNYRNVYKKKARLILVGSTEFKPYYQHLKNLVKKFDIKDIEFLTGLNKSQLRACYESSDIFLCLSEHEGFCMPLVEAMYMGVPVVAYDTSAIGDTLGGAGVLINDNNPSTVSTAINHIINDEQYRKSILEGQNERVKQMSNEIVEQNILSLLESLTPPLEDNAVSRMFSNSRKIAFVVQRYGEEINGGAETECRMLAEHLKSYYEVEVLTSCVTSVDTDVNVYPEGVTVLSDVTVRRFKAVKQRNLARFIELGSDLNSRPDYEVQEWVDEMGPCCPELIDYLAAHSEEYMVIIFVTYLFYTSIKGLSLNLKNAVFFPTAHDEDMIYFNLYRKCFEQTKGFIYNSYEEKALVDRLFNTRQKPFYVSGVGIDIPDEKINNNVKEKYNLPQNYVVYAGRIRDDKGCDKLLEFFVEYKRRNNNNLQLVMIGKIDYGFDTRMDDFVTYLGFISEEDKNGVMKNAKALILPSRNESLSLVVLESLYLGRPVLVNGACPVLTAHCFKSNAGLYYNTYFEFERAINFFLENQKVYNRMSHLGKDYVRKNYSWNTITNNLVSFIESNFR